MAVPVPFWTNSWSRPAAPCDPGRVHQCLKVLEPSLNRPSSQLRDLGFKWPAARFRQKERKAVETSWPHGSYKPGSWRLITELQSLRRTLCLCSADSIGKRLLDKTYTAPTEAHALLAVAVLSQAVVARRVARNGCETSTGERQDHKRSPTDDKIWK